MRFLRQSTQTDVVIGPVWSTTDGALKSDLAYNASGINCDVYKGATKADVTLASGAGDGYFRAGSGEAQYIITLPATALDTIGRLRLTLSATGYYSKPEDFSVLDEAVYDVLFGTTALATTIGTGSGLTAIPWNTAWDAEVQSEAQDAITASALATAANLATAVGYIDTEVASILAAVDTEIAAIVSELAKVPKSDSTVSWNATALAAIKTAIEAAGSHLALIKTKTDNLPASPAAVGSNMGTITNVTGTIPDVTLAAAQALYAPSKAGDAMTLTAAYDAAKTAATQTSVNDIPTNAELATALAGADDAVLAAIAALNDLDSAGAQAAAEAALAAYGAATGLDVAGAVVGLSTFNPVTSSVDVGSVVGVAVLGVDDFKADVSGLAVAGEAAAAVVGLAATGEAATAVAGLNDISAADVWTNAERTLTSAGSGGATLEEIEASALLAMKSDVEAVGTAVGALNDFDPATDPVAHVTLVDTVTTNSDMRGTDSALLAASYTAPDNAGIADLPTNAELAAALAAADDAVLAAVGALSIPSAATVASAVRTNLATELARLDAAVSTRLATTGYAAAPSAADVTAAVWAAVSRTLTAFGFDVTVDEEAIAAAVVAGMGEVTVDTAAIAAAVVAGLGSLSVTVQAPVAANGTLTIYRGDDYAVANGTGIAFTLTGAPDLTGATVLLKLKALTLEAVSCVASGTNWIVTFEATSAQTQALTAPGSYEIEATLADTHRRTLQTGHCAVLEDIPAIVDTP